MKKELLLIFCLILSTSFILASYCPPSIPVTYYGKILDNNDNVISGNFEISAWVGGYESFGEVIDGNYEIDVSSCYGGSRDEVEFSINLIKANEHPVWNGELDFGRSFVLNLTFDEEIPDENPCGNGALDSGEVCDKNDFGDLSCSNYGFASGSLSCSESCLYIYTDGCYNSYYDDDDDDDDDSTDDDKNDNTGGNNNGDSPNGGSSTIILNKTTDAQTTNEENTIGLNGNQEPTSPGITGAIIGFIKSRGGLIVLIFSVLIIVIGIGVIVIKKKHKTSKNE